MNHSDCMAIAGLKAFQRGSNKKGLAIYNGG